MRQVKKELMDRGDCHFFNWWNSYTLSMYNFETASNKTWIILALSENTIIDKGLNRAKRVILKNYFYLLLWYSKKGAQKRTKIYMYVCLYVIYCYQYVRYSYVCLSIHFYVCMLVLKVITVYKWFFVWVVIFYNWR